MEAVDHGIRIIVDRVAAGDSVSFRGALDPAVATSTANRSGRSVRPLERARFEHREIGRQRALSTRAARPHMEDHGPLDHAGALHDPSVSRRDRVVIESVDARREPADAVQRRE